MSAISFDNLLKTIHGKAKTKKSKKKQKTGDAALIDSKQKSTEKVDDNEEKLHKTTNVMIAGAKSSGDLEAHRKMMKIRKDIQQHHEKHKDEVVLTPAAVDEIEVKGRITKASKKENKLLEKKLKKKKKRDKKLKQKKEEEEKKNEELEVEQPAESQPNLKEKKPRRTFKVIEHKFRKDGVKKRTKTRSRQKNKRKDNRSLEDKMSKLGSKFIE